MITKLVEELKKLESQSEGTDNLQRIEKQHSKGKLTARERLNLLLDEGSFMEFDKFVTHKCQYFGMDKKKPLGDAVITGKGKINGRDVFVFSQDFTIFGGSVSKVVAEKITKIIDLAAKTGKPIIGINDSGGARIQEGVDSLAGYGDIFFRNVRLSGVVPQISIIAGPCAGGAVYSPALTDFVIMVDKIANMFVTGPDVVKAVTGEEVTKEELGGATVHTTKTQVASYKAIDEEDAFAWTRQLLRFLPDNNASAAPLIDTQDKLRTTEEIYSIIQTDPKKPYDVKKIIETIVDDNYFFEIQEKFAQNIVVGFASINKIVVGIVANQPTVLAGAIDYKAATKAARFVRFCDAFDIPILTLVDVPGFMPGVVQEHSGIIAHGAKLLYAYAEATVPKITLILRKAYGGAYIVMGSKHLGADVNLAYPSAEIAVMGPEGAVKILYKHQLKDVENPQLLEQKFVEEYRTQFANPYIAANNGYIDAVIDPKDTRIKIYEALDFLLEKREKLPPKKHGNIPL